MPLLNKRLLHDAIKKHNREVSTTLKQDLQALFRDTLNRIDTGKFKKEESEKVPFLQRLFELLGYKLHENLEFEYTTQGRSIDGVLGIQSDKGREVEVAIEWKGIDTKNLDKGKAGETPVSQMWDYMGKVGAEIGIVGNFLEFRIYTLKTKQTEYQQYFLRELSNQDEKLDEFIFLLKSEHLLKNNSKQSLLEALISQSEAEQEQITKRFYNDYKQRRLNLFQHLVEHNLETDKHLLLEKSQKILDRLVFIMFCEDGLLLPGGTIRQVFETARNSFGGEDKIWNQFKGLFEAIDKGSDHPKINAFNGGLFAQDLELNKLIIKDTIWQDLIKLAEYDFESDLNVNILGHIFEQSISDIEEIKNEIEGLSTDKKKSKRKKDGIYYTPEYITDYIVSETIGGWLKDPSNRLEDIKVLDPAGGSGAFPNQVHNFLAKKHVEQIKNKAESEGFDPNLVDIDEKVIDKSILKNNIFMVDLQPESVEIAKLSLWLKTAKKDQKLNNLDENVKCGNSLISDPKIAGSSAFDWDKEFPEVMASGGFDVIVGNPPWVDIKKLEPNLVKTLFKKYKTAKNRINLYAIFIEKGLSLLKNNGYLGFIIPSSLLMNESYDALRMLVLKDFDIKSIIKLPDNVFEEVKMETMIMILKKGKSKHNNIAIRIYDRDETITKVEVNSKIIEQISWENDGCFNIYASNNDLIFTKKIEEIQNKLANCCEFSLGITPYDKYTGQDLELIKLRGYHSKLKIDETYKPLIDGGDVNRYIISPSNNEYIKYGSWLGAMREERFFNQPHIVVRQIVNQRIFAGYTEEKLYNTQIGFNLLAKDGWNLKYILAVLNSEILNRYHNVKYLDQTKNLFQKILIANAKQLPIPIATAEQQNQVADLVDQIMAHKSNSQNLTNTFLKLISAKYKPVSISTKLKNWHKLEINEFLQELKKQKAEIGGLSAESELITYFEEQKEKVVRQEAEAERVDSEIEGLVRGLYGID